VGYKNPAVDAAITELKKAATDEAKTAAFKKISDAWAADAPSVPIAHVEERVVWGSKVRGLSTTAQNQVVFTKAWIAG
jgi:ABC-type oligopeptide transport system substrate-binding subunit